MTISRFTIASLLSKRVESAPKSSAYIYENHSYTWRDVDLLASHCALYLKEAGVKKNDMIGLWGVNTIEWIICFFAIEKLGAIAVLINYSYKECEAKYILDYTDVSLILVGESKPDLDYKHILAVIKPQLSKLKKVVYMSDAVQSLNSDEVELTNEQYKELDEIQGSITYDDGACIIFTSGTTSRPKGVVLSHKNVINDAISIGENMHWTSEDRQLLVMPMFHCSGLVPGILAGVSIGMETVVLRYFQSAPVMKNIEKYKCTIFSAVPSMLIIMMNRKDFYNYDLSSYHSGTLAGSTILPEKYKEVCKAFHLEKLQMAYGQTETSPLVAISEYLDSLEKKSTTVGKALPGIQIRIWNEEKKKEAEIGISGEIQVLGFCNMKGYYKVPEQEIKKYEKDGWLKTGDVGYFDKDGYLHFSGRSDDMINRGGENISPREIEQCICRFSENIIDVKVVGVADEMVQEEIAVLVLSKENSNLENEEIRKHVKKYLARFKVPRYVFQLSNFPLNTSGKPDNKKLKEIANEMVLDEKTGRKEY